MGIYVPTRKEVATLPPADLRTIIIDWMWESPSELIPSREQISQVRTVLAERPDSDDDVIDNLIRECDDYIKPSDH